MSAPDTLTVQGARTRPPVLTAGKWKAMDCERHYALRYLHRTPGTSGEGLRRYDGFALYRAGYARHLRVAGESTDPAWVKEWAPRQGFTADALELIWCDLSTFALPPGNRVYVELFLAVRPGWVPYDKRELEDGYPRLTGDLMATVILPLLDIQGDTARVLVPRTGFDTSTDTREAVLAAALLFAHFPDVAQVEYVWDFVRSQASAPLNFHRAVFPWLQHDIDAMVARLGRVAERDRLDSSTLDVDPSAGLCGRCAYTCPLRDAMFTGSLELGPVGNDVEAVALGLRLMAGRGYVKQAAALLKNYLAGSETGRVELGHGWEAVSAVDAASEYPLDRVLEMLGYPALRDTSPNYNVPLDALLVGSSGLKDKAKARTRQGMFASLDGIARRRPRTRLKLRHAASSSEEEVID